VNAGCPRIEAGRQQREKILAAPLPGVPDRVKNMNPPAGERHQIRQRRKNRPFWGRLFFDNQAAVEVAITSNWRPLGASRAGRQFLAISA
jgi:hypothetical protein